MQFIASSLMDRSHLKRCIGVYRLIEQWHINARYEGPAVVIRPCWLQSTTALFCIVTDEYRIIFAQGQVKVLDLCFSTLSVCGKRHLIPGWSLFCAYVLNPPPPFKHIAQGRNTHFAYLCELRD